MFVRIPLSGKRFIQISDGVVTSNLRSYLRGAVGNHFASLIESIVLEHAQAGVHVHDRAYIEGIEKSIEKFLVARHFR